MKKRYILENLDCANCAAKMEAAISKMDGVGSASVSFMLQKLTVDLHEGMSADSFKYDAQKIISAIEPDCRLIEK